jgi:hypothetical protein
MKELAVSQYLQIVIEVGYSGTHKELIDNACDWLLFLHRAILSIIIFKWTKLLQEEDFEDVTKWGLFGEVYERCIVNPSLITATLKLEPGICIIRMPWYAMGTGSSSCPILTPLQCSNCCHAIFSL